MPDGYIILYFPSGCLRPFKTSDMLLGWKIFIENLLVYLDSQIENKIRPPNHSKVNFAQSCTISILMGIYLIGSHGDRRSNTSNVFYVSYFSLHVSIAMVLLDGFFCLHFNNINVESFCQLLHLATFNPLLFKTSISRVDIYCT